MEDLTLSNVLLTTKTYDNALALLKQLIQLGNRNVKTIRLRDLSERHARLDLEMAIFNTWGVPYHVDRRSHCHITDIEAITLVLYEKAPIELSVTLLGDDAITVLIIGTCVIVERSREPGVAHVLLSEGLENG